MWLTLTGGASLLVVAVDLGFGWTKAVGNGKLFAEPSVLGPAASVIEGLGANHGIRLWDTDGQQYFVGKLAVQQCDIQWHSLADDKVSDANTMRLLRASLAAVAPVANGSWAVEYLVTGLPVNLWAVQRETMLRSLMGLQNTPLRAQLGSSNITLTFSVRNARVLAQPYGSLLDLVLDDRGMLARRDAAAGRTLVVDVGFHTVDLLAADGLEIISRLSTGTNFGVATALGTVAKQMNKPVWEIDQMVLKKGPAILDHTLQALAGNIAGSIESLNERFDLYLLTGGGGRLVHPYLHLPGRVEVMPDAHLGNVRGYLKAAERLRRQALSA